MWQRRTRDVESSLDIDGQHPVPVQRRSVHGGPEQHHARVVDDDIESAERLDRLLHNGGGLHLVVNPKASTTEERRTTSSPLSCTPVAVQPRVRERQKEWSPAPCSARKSGQQRTAVLTQLSPTRRARGLMDRRFACPRSWEARSTPVNPATPLGTSTIPAPLRIVASLSSKIRLSR